MPPVPTETTSLTRDFDRNEISDTEDFLGTLPSGSTPSRTGNKYTATNDSTANQSTNNDAINVAVNNINSHVIGTSVRVASLNCWGLYIYPSRSTRYQAIGKHLLDSNYDIVTLQEVWIQSDMTKLISAVKGMYPYNHFFKSGFMGSGLLVLSKHPIERTGWLRFSLNGQPQMFHHGDWYAGKGVGVCRIKLGGVNAAGGAVTSATQDTSFVIDVYNTHLHAEYDKKSRKYELHQLSQLIEYRRLIEAISIAGNVPFIATGDLNCFPDSFVYRAAIQENCLSYHSRGRSERCQLADAWNDSKERVHPHDSETGYTFNLPSSYYYKPKKAAQRIDYIHYNPSNMIPLKSEVIVKHRGVTMSDHGLINSDFIVLPREVTTTKTEREALSPFMDRQLKDQLNEQFESLYQRDLRSLDTRQAVLRTIAILATVIFLALFVLAIVMVMVGLGSGLAQAAIISISPIPLAISIIVGMMSELGVAEERAALISFERDWHYWYMNN